MKHPPFRFDRADLWPVSRMIHRSLTDRLGVSVLALTVQCWHVHVVVGPTVNPVAKIVKTAKDAVRWGLRPGRPIWADGYDKRFCFNRASLAARVRYVEKHNERGGGQACPWDFVAAQTPGESPGANGPDVSAAGPGQRWPLRTCRSVGDWSMRFDGHETHRRTGATAPY